MFVLSKFFFLCVSLLALYFASFRCIRDCCAFNSIGMHVLVGVSECRPFNRFSAALCRICLAACCNRLSVVNSLTHIHGFYGRFRRACACVCKNIWSRLSMRDAINREVKQKPPISTVTIRVHQFVVSLFRLFVRFFR